MSLLDHAAKWRRDAGRWRAAGQPEKAVAAEEKAEALEKRHANGGRDLTPALLQLLETRRR